ncbi:DNA-binding response regulator [Gemmatimonadetes bacterium T265]|nr:DNA-binding response regulator [Gemmatimonadetes bacterium T265]
MVVGECENGIQALDAITRLGPELVFLDVQMPDLDGLGVVDALGSADQVTCPQIVFVTAYNAYMERAFEVHAVDYLRKPYTTARFQSALAHGRRQVLLRRAERESVYPAGYAAAVAALQSEIDDGTIRVHVRETSTWHVIPTEEIGRIESDGSAHVRIHRGPNSYRWRKSLAECEQKLARRGFLRVHRSYVVNTARIRSVKSLQKGEFALLLDDGTAIDTGRTFRDAVLNFLNRR